jgi:hypothetical protein
MSINQRDDEEKTGQVRMMRAVYAKAERVIIWLRKDKPKAIEAIKLLDLLYESGVAQNTISAPTSLNSENLTAKNGAFQVRFLIPLRHLFPALGPPLVQPCLCHPRITRCAQLCRMARLVGCQSRRTPVDGTQIGRNRDLYNMFRINISTVTLSQRTTLL